MQILENRNYMHRLLRKGKHGRMAEGNTKGEQTMTRLIDANAPKKEGRKERGMATRDTAERKTASRENGRIGNNAKTD